MNAGVSIHMSDRMRAFLKENWIPGVMTEALTEVAKTATGPGGIFASHLQAGQSEWPDDSDKWIYDDRKRDGRKFVNTGKVERAIKQDLSAFGAQMHTGYFGSSADTHTTAAKAIQATSNGLFVRVRQSRAGAELLIGFVGTLKHSAKFKKMLYRGKTRIFEGETRRTIAEQAKASGVKLRSGARKWAARGSKGMTLKAGKAGFAKAGEKDNLGYANIVQRGAFKGAGGASPQQLGSMRRRGALTSAPNQFGKARPLLVAKSSDGDRVSEAFKRGLASTMKRMGWMT